MRHRIVVIFVFFFFQAEDGIRDAYVTGVQTCALPISREIEYEHVARPHFGYSQAYRLSDVVPRRLAVRERIDRHLGKKPGALLLKTGRHGLGIGRRKFDAFCERVVSIVRHTRGHYEQIGGLLAPFDVHPDRNRTGLELIAAIEYGRRNLAPPRSEARRVAQE